MHDTYHGFLLVLWMNTVVSMALENATPQVSGGKIILPILQTQAKGAVIAIY